jgi:hypothetical protein
LRTRKRRGERKEKIMKTTMAALSLALVILGAAGCSPFTSYQTESVVPEHKIMIDGKSEDWVGSLYVAPGETISIGFLNDQQDLYVCMIAEDRATRAQIMTQGLTVWFDPQGGTQKVFGIRYPMGTPKGELPKPPDPLKEMEVPEDYKSVDLTRLEIIGGEKAKPQLMEASNVKGIEIKLVPSTGLLVYELKIPLLRTEEYPFAVGVNPGRAVGIGFESPEIDLSKLQKKEKEEKPEGGKNPPSEGRYGQGRRGGYGMRFPMLRGIKVWANVQLASGPSVRTPGGLTFER